MRNSDSNPLMAYFTANKSHLIHKWLHYFDIYHLYFAKFRKKEVTLLEFGVSHGGSLQMWKHYFGKKIRIIGVDINPECRKFEEANVSIFIGDQEDRAFLRKLMKKVGPVDIIIDDGGHTMGQQITTFEETYPYVREGGIYLAEDLHTSYWHEFGGGLRKNTSFIEYAKALIDQLHAWHSRDPESLVVDEFTKTTRAIHFYDSIVVFEKGAIEPPMHKQIGIPMLSQVEHWDYRDAGAELKEEGKA